MATATASGPKRVHKFLLRELNLLRRESTPNLSFELVREDNITDWTVEMRGAAGTLYEGEVFHLRFQFGDDYPFKPPKVKFVPPHVPLHPHVFSNGDICLSILTKEWAPALHVQGVCLSVLSMLSSCKDKKLPPDNTYYLHMAKTAPHRYNWSYYNDKA